MALSGVCLAEIVWHCLPLLPQKTDSRIKAKAEFSGQSLIFKEVQTTCNRSCPKYCPSNVSQDVCLLILANSLKKCCL